MSRFDPRFAPTPPLPEMRTVTIYGFKKDIEMYEEGDSWVAECEGKIIYARSAQAAFESMLESLSIDLYTEE